MRLALGLALTALTSLTFSQLDPSATTPPTAKRIPELLDIHGKALLDPYAWLKNKKNPDTIAFIEAENAYREKVMEPTLPFQKALYDQIVARIQEDDDSVPVFENGYWYYSRMVKGKDYAIHCRRKGTMTAKEEIYLDENTLAQGQPFFSLGLSTISPDNRYLAYSTDVTGFREYYVFIKDLKTGKLLPDRFGKVGSVVWASDNKTLFFDTEDAAKRTDRVWRQQIGSKTRKLIYQEKDELFTIGIGSTTDKKHLIIGSYSKDTNELHTLSLNKPTSSPKMIAARGNKHEYSLDSHLNNFYITTNDQGPNYRVVVAPISNPDRKNWKQVIPHSKTNVISGVQCFKDFQIIGGRTNGFPTLQIRSFSTGKTIAIPTADQVASIYPGGNPEFDTKTVNYSYTSLTTPASTYRYDIKTGKSKLLKQQPVKNFNSQDYVSELKWATAQDGTKIPISLVRKKTTTPSASTPLFLYAYGSYGAPSDPRFSISRLNYLDRGFIYAIAHIRGGGEFGRDWYNAGKMFNKMNTFTDFIDCGDYLVKENYTSHNRMAINGGSAGGLLIGAVINMRPDLAHVAVADVPFVDVINTMLDESLPLTVGEFIEWGNPKKPKEFEYMLSCSPYDNVKAQEYPHLLITTSLNDSQVLFHEPTKWVAKLRATKTGDNVLLFRCNMDAGHGGASGRYSALEEVANTQAFVLTQLGFKE